jgi:hypothetical protein
VETSGGDSGNVQTHGGLRGLHNKPTGCSASGAYAPGPEEEKKKNPQYAYIFVILPFAIKKYKGKF